MEQPELDHRLDRMGSRGGEEKPKLISSDLSKAGGSTPSQGPERKSGVGQGWDRVGRRLSPGFRLTQCLKGRFRSPLFRDVRGWEVAPGHVRQKAPWLILSY